MRCIVKFVFVLLALAVLTVGCVEEDNTFEDTSEFVTQGSALGFYSDWEWVQFPLQDEETVVFSVFNNAGLTIPVYFHVIDPSGNSTAIGTATTPSSGAAVAFTFDAGNHSACSLGYCSIRMQAKSNWGSFRATMRSVEYGTIVSLQQRRLGAMYSYEDFVAWHAPTGTTETLSLVITNPSLTLTRTLSYEDEWLDANTVWTAFSLAPLETKEFTFTGLTGEGRIHFKTTDSASITERTPVLNVKYVKADGTYSYYPDYGTSNGYLNLVEDQQTSMDIYIPSITSTVSHRMYAYDEDCAICDHGTPDPACDVSICIDTPLIFEYYYSSYVPMTFYEYSLASWPSNGGDRAFRFYGPAIVRLDTPDVMVPMPTWDVQSLGHSFQVPVNNYASVELSLWNPLGNYVTVNIAKRGQTTPVRVYLDPYEKRNVTITGLASDDRVDVIVVSTGSSTPNIYASVQVSVITSVTRPLTTQEYFMHLTPYHP